MTTKIPKYPNLYILNANGKTYEWNIEIAKNEDETYSIITTHGQQDGKMVIHKSQIKEGKVNRNILDQAILEANRKWKNKKEKELYTESLTELTNNETDLIFRPMLANKFNPDAYKKGGRSFKISFPAYVQPKLDGLRCVSYLKNGTVIMESRTGHIFENFELLKKQLKYILDTLPSNFYFDGELYTDEIDFEVLSGLIRQSEKKCTEQDLILINKISYHIYDFYDSNNAMLKYHDRFQRLNDILYTNQEYLSLCHFVPTYFVHELSEVLSYHENFVKDNFEGIMIRDRDGIYEVNKRSKYLQKYKDMMEDEFKIIGFTDGKGDEEGAIVWECITKEGNTFSVRPKGTFETRKKLFLEGKKYIGKFLTVIFQGYSSENNVPRFGRGKDIRENY